MAPAHVLVPLDGSPLADAALAHALETFDCAVTVLNVVTPIERGMSESGVLDREDREREARERAQSIVDEARRRAEARGQPVETAVEEGPPAETVLEYVDDHDVDHVVMGGHGGTDGIVTRLLGSVATTVVAEAPVTVTVVRDSDAEERREQAVDPEAERD